MDTFKHGIFYELQQGNLVLIGVFFFFSTRFAAHAWFELAEECAQVTVPPHEYRRWLLEKVAKYLKMQSVGLVVEFDPHAYLYEPDALHFARIGSGSLCVFQ